MKRLSALTASVALLAVPAVGHASTTRGLILSVDSQSHTVQVVDGRHVVRAYRYAGPVSGLRLGSRVRFQRTGATMRGVARAGHASRVSFLARVVSARAGGAVLRLGDGTRMTLARSLDPGVMALVTEARRGRGRRVTAPPASSPGVAGEHRTTGVVTMVGSGGFSIRTAHGVRIGLRMASGAPAAAGLKPCDAVTASYRQRELSLVADKVRITGLSFTGSCTGEASALGDAGGGAGGSGGSGDGSASGGDDSGDGGDQDAIGTVTRVSATSVTISVPGRGSMTFAMSDPDLTDGIDLGDEVDVTYALQPDGSLVASDVEYDELDATGTVVAVNAGSITIVDSGTGQQETFSADPSEDLFDGVSVGDDVDVTYHESSAGPVADEVD